MAAECDLYPPPPIARPPRPAGRPWGFRPNSFHSNHGEGQAQVLYDQSSEELSQLAVAWRRAGQPFGVEGNSQAPKAVPRGVEFWIQIALLAATLCLCCLGTTTFHSSSLMRAWKSMTEQASRVLKTFACPNSAEWQRTKGADCNGAETTVTCSMPALLASASARFACKLGCWGGPELERTPQPKTTRKHLRRRTGFPLD
jgi:hypothetical protein